MRRRSLYIQPMLTYDAVNVHFEGWASFEHVDRKAKANDTLMFPQAGDIGMQTNMQANTICHNVVNAVTLHGQSAAL